MKPELNIALKAIESGKYKKAEGVLRIGNAYCIQGALCDQYKEITGEGKWVNGYKNTYWFELRMETSKIEMPSIVQDFFMLPDFVHVNEGSIKTDMLTLNDDLEFSLQEIAGLLRKEVEN